MVIGVSESDLKIAYESYAMARWYSQGLGKPGEMAETATTHRGAGNGTPQAPTDLSKRTWMGTLTT